MKPKPKLPSFCAKRIGVAESPERSPASTPATISSTRSRGKLHEQRALRFLAGEGLKLVQANFQCRAGEVDLIMRDRRGSVVFVEVRYRKSDRYGSALETIGPVKQRRLRLAAGFFLNARKWQNRPCRFDVVAITGGGPGKEDRLEWIRDAFS